MRRRGLVAVATLLVLSLVAVGVVAFVVSRAGDPPAKATGQSQQAAVLPPTAAQVAAVEERLGTGRVADMRHVFGIPPGNDLDPRFVEQMRSLESITLDPDSFAATGSATGEIRAVVEGEAGSAQQWTLLLERVGDDWLISGTREVS